MLFLVAVAVVDSSQIRGDHAVVAGRDINARDIIFNSLTEDEIRSLIEEYQKKDSPSVQKVAELSEKLGITHGAISNFFRILGEKPVSFENLIEKLSEIANQHLRLLEKIREFQAEAPYIGTADAKRLKALLDKATQAIEDGNYTQAKKFLTELESASVANAQRYQESADKHWLEAAKAREQKARIALTRFHYGSAIAEFKAAADLAPASKPEIRAQYLASAARLQRSFVTLEAILYFGYPVLQVDWLSEAQNTMEKALDIIRANLGREHPTTAIYLTDLALIYRDRWRGPMYPYERDQWNDEKDFQKSIELIQHSLEIRKKTLGEKHSLYAENLALIGALFSEKATIQRSSAVETIDSSMLKRSEASLRQAIEILESKNDQNIQLLADSLTKLGSLLRLKFDLHQNSSVFDQALEVYDRVVTLYKKNLPSDKLKLASAYNDLGILYSDAINHNNSLFSPGEQAFFDALTIWREFSRGDAPRHAAHITIWLNFADFYDAASHASQAFNIYERLLLDLGGLYGRMHPVLLPVYDNFSSFLLTKGDSQGKHLRDYANYIRSRIGLSIKP